MDAHEGLPEARRGAGLIRGGLLVGLGDGEEKRRKAL